MSSRIVVTGASGFVGINLCAGLERAGFIVDRLGRGDLDNLIGGGYTGDTIIHLAGKAHDTKNVAAPEDYYMVNFELTRKVYDYFVASEFKSFIFLSSVKAAADRSDIALTEDVPPQPETHYGRSKLMAERYIQAQVPRGGKRYFILRPCMIHGPGNKGNLNLLYQFVRRGLPYPLAAFECKRSFLSVENLNLVIHHLLIRDGIVSGVYNVADDEALSTNQLIQIIAGELRLEPKLWRIPRMLINAAAVAGDFFKLPLNRNNLSKLTESYIVSNRKIREALAIDLMIGSEEGIRKTVRSFNSK